MTTATQPATFPDQLLNALRWRYATKQFDPQKKIPAALWATLEDALVLSASSYGLQPYRFFVIDNPSLRDKLRAVSWNQPQIVDASHLVVFAIRTKLDAAHVERYVQRAAQVRQIPPAALDGYKGMMLAHVGRSGEGFDIDAWSARQTYIALGNFLTTAAVLGVDACPMEGFDPAKYDEILGLPAKGCHAVVIATAGYRSEKDATANAPKVRFAKADLVEHFA